MSTPGPEPAPREPAPRQRVADAQRERIWDLYLRGVPKRRIAAAVGVHRGTVARVLTALYRELAGERKERVERKLDAAIARMRRIQEQAWEDHDRAGGDEQGSAGQRSAHLRIALDAEKEIARLEGLYDGVLDDGAAVVIRVERLGAPGARAVMGREDVPQIDDGQADGHDDGHDDGHEDA